MCIWLFLMTLNRVSILWKTWETWNFTLEFREFLKKFSLWSFCCCKQSTLAVRQVVNYVIKIWIFTCLCLFYVFNKNLKYTVFFIILMIKNENIMQVKNYLTKAMQFFQYICKSRTWKINGSCVFFFYMNEKH